MLRFLLIILGSVILHSTIIAQEESKDCIRWNAILSKFNGTTENWKEAASYFIKAENACADFGKDNYDRLLTCIQNVLDEEEEDSDSYYSYLDTLIWAWERAEDNGHYDPIDDISRGYHYTLLQTPNYQKADTYMARAIKTEGAEISDEVYLLLYYYNIYSLWYLEENSETKEILKQRYLNEYLVLCTIINDRDYTEATRETLTQYLAQAIHSCDELIPLFEGFLATLSLDTMKKESELVQFGRLLSENGCKNTEAFQTISDLLYEINPDKYRQEDLGPRTCSEKIPSYKEILANTNDAEKKNEIQYNIAACYMQIGSYMQAYTAAKLVTGELKPKSLQIQAGCVAATANSCGETTFERKCNYLYAASLMEEAGLDGSKYRVAGPQIEHCSTNQEKISLSCWGITIDLMTGEVVSEE